MRLQTLLENVGSAWMVVIDANDGYFADDDVFSCTKLFATESAAVDYIFEHIYKELSDEEDQEAEIEKLRKRTKTVQAVLKLLETNDLLSHLDGVIMAQKMEIN